MMRLPALLALVAVSLTSACATTPATRGAAIAGGIATAVVGGLVYSQGPVDADHNGVNDTVLDDNWGAYLLGGMLLTAGIGMAIAGLASTAVEDARDTPAPQHIVYAPAPVAFAPQGRAALPEMQTNGDAIQDAQQIRSLVEGRQCGAAWMMWHRLEVTDHAYAVALRDGAVMAACPINVDAPMP